jgi:hypothetical protein
MASDALTSAALLIEHAATGKKVQFFQIKMTGFTDTVTPSWSEENVYGRMDPIATYQGTTRAIELSFDIGPFSDSDDRKKLALQKISRLMQFQYPTYSEADSTTSISRPPLLNVSFANYIRAGTGTDEALLCYMTGMAYNPVDGMSSTTTPKVVDDGSPTILPQRIAVSLSFKVLHGEAPGWGDSSGEWDGGDHWGPYETPSGLSDTDLAEAPTGPTGIEAEETALEDVLNDD